MRGQMAMVDLIQTENKFFNKIIMAFAGLCLEATEMEKVAYERYYGPLSIFGELHVEQEPTDGHSSLTYCARPGCSLPWPGSRPQLIPSTPV